MHYVPAYLQPLTQADTGLESQVVNKVDEVESIDSQSDKVDIKQNDKPLFWRYKEILEGKTVIEHGRKIKREEEVDYPNRHWWIVTDGLLEDLDPPLRSHADIFDLITAINLCISEPVAFSQSPGQVVSGAYQVRKGALEYRDLSIGSIPLAVSTMNDIPSEVQVSESIDRVYGMVRFFRSNRIESDEDMDIRIGLHMYDDALTSSLWTTMSNLFFVCENTLCSGKSTNVADRIAEITDMSQEEAKNWKNTVNRLKHPDKGDVPSMIQTNHEVPTLWYMRQTTNTAIIHTMETRFDETQT